MRKHQTAVVLIALLLATHLVIWRGMSTKAEAGADYTTNIPDFFNVPVERADCSTGCWRLISAIYEPEEVSGGTHHIYTMEPHDPKLIMKVCVTGVKCYAVPLDKPANEPAGNFAMFAGAQHCVFIEGAPSDEICNLKMRGPTPESEHQAHHINYKLTWEWRVDGPPPITQRVYLPLVGN